MKKEQGFNLLECLLVLVVIAAVSMIGIHRYYSYQYNIQLANMKSDIAVIQSALNRYYHTIACRSDGSFPENKRTPSLAELGLVLPKRYRAEIIGNNVYALQVAARFSSTYSKEKMHWYQKILGAQNILGNRLIWITLPSLTASARGTKLWVMKSGEEQFRQQENTAWKKAMGKKPDDSPSFCPH